MKIGELAKLTGLATSRIRFYEASGLIRSQRKANGYRDYAADTVWILELVTGAQGAGFSLEEIARLLPSGDGAWQHGELLEGLRRKVAEIEALQRRLEQNKAQLLVGHRKHREQAGRPAVHGKHPARAGAPARGRPSPDGRASTANPLAGVLSHAGGAAAFRRLTLKST